MPTTSTYVPTRLDATRWEEIEPLLTGLRERAVRTPEDLQRWLEDRSDVEAACAEAESDLYISMTCHTDDAEAAGAFTRYIETIPPKLKPAIFELDKRQVELFKQFKPDPRRYEVIDRDTRAEVDLFRPENVPIQTELEKLSQEYQTISGAMTVAFEGREQTLPMMAKYQESTDRAVREGAWRAVAERRLRDADAIEAIFDRMIALRDTMARQAGLASFVQYAFKSRRRFDYTPEQCRVFHDAVARVVVPFVKRQQARRRALLGATELRPWDLAVDPKGRPPLKPFNGGVELMAKSVRTFERLDPRLARMLATLGDGSNTNGSANGACLDLDSRKGKAPGGYQAMRDRTRRPFIFMNAAGLHRDVETMVHEAGHAFHSLLCVDEPLMHYRHAPLEFCEVASMSMELLTMPHWSAADGFYPSRADADRARRKQVEGSVSLLPWIATIDAFQHWLYTHPSHTREERAQAWLAIDDRFGPDVSWDGLEATRRTLWHRQSHLFGAPFYYIEYGIAQLGALQLWLRSLEEGPRAAIESYLAALRLGGSRPLPELFAAAGIRFDFGADIVARLVERVERELERLPE
ncbi:MAG: M3 family oligoendopeptidase [Phycisphaerae bacterium]|nr:M3 family oligoendopeptidase [Phycisphaerae bacterium]